MTIAVVLVLLVIGTLIFHFLSPWWFTPIASNWSQMDDTVVLTFVVTGVVFVVVNLFLAWVVIRYRHRKGQKADYEPENKKLEWWLTGITTVGVAAMLAPGLFVWGKFVTVPEDATEVEVVGAQWNWSYRFPGADGELGASDVSLMDVANPLGVDPSDPAGQDDVVVLGPEVHLPIGRPVKLLLRSKDVLHDFTVPQFRVKMDMVPGMVTYMWLTPTKTGEYDVLCEELCGLAHFAMRGRVVVDEADKYHAWLSSQPTFAVTQARATADAAAGGALYAVCSACHGPEAEGNPALNAPKLAGQQPWYLHRQLKNFQKGLRGAQAGDTYGTQMTAFAATLADDAAIENVLAYIAGLPDHPAPKTVAGDAARGAALYPVCAACHGATGQGVWTQSAPRLSQMSDWYLVRQLQNFKQGVRGVHRQDFYGAQMAAMSDTLKDERAINDLVAYINSLPPPRGDQADGRAAMTAMTDGGRD
jgi:cytochrome c oxidase subunit 2